MLTLTLFVDNLTYLCYIEYVGSSKLERIMGDTMSYKVKVAIDRTADFSYNAYMNEFRKQMKISSSEVLQNYKIKHKMSGGASKTLWITQRVTEDRDNRTLTIISENDGKSNTATISFMSTGDKSCDYISKEEFVSGESAVVSFLQMPFFTRRSRINKMRARGNAVKQLIESSV